MRFLEWLEAHDTGHRALVFFTNGEKFLALRYADSDVWTIPGGHMQEGEEAFKAAKREAKEECGFFEGEHFGEASSNTHSIFLVAVDRQRVCHLSKEHDKWRWAAMDEIDRLNWTPSLKPLLDRCEAQTKKRFMANEDGDLNAYSTHGGRDRFGYAGNRRQYHTAPMPPWDRKSYRRIMAKRKQKSKQKSEAVIPVYQRAKR